MQQILSKSPTLSKSPQLTVQFSYNVLNPNNNLAIKQGFTGTGDLIFTHDGAPYTTKFVQSRSFWRRTASKCYDGRVTAQTWIPTRIYGAYWGRKYRRKPPRTSSNWLRNLFLRGDAKTVFAMLAKNWSIQCQLVLRHWTMLKAHL